MKNRLAVLIVMIAAGGLLISWIDREWNAASEALQPPQQQTVPPKLRVFTDAQGRTAQFTTPLLDMFPYPGDKAVCARVNVLKAAFGSDDVLNVGDCDTLSTLSPRDKSARLAQLAEQISTLTSAQPWQKEDDKDSDIVLALSCLKEALDILPSDSGAAAMTALERSWITGFTSDHFKRYDPPFLFHSAFKIEAGRAQIALCPLSGRTDCAEYIPAGIIQALIEVGRWRSQYALLVDAADLLEKRNDNLKNPTKEDQLHFAEDFSSALGYAAEIVTGDQSIAFLRRGVAPLVRWLDANQHDVGDYELSHIVTTLGAEYGRIADRTVDKADADKAVNYDSWAFQLKQKFSKSDGWEALCNLGDSTLLEAEINHDEAGFKQALQDHRDALAMALDIGDQQDIVYSKMKLARTLVHYEQAKDLSLSHDARIAMLNEAATAAREIIPFTNDTGTRVYSDIIRNVLADAEKGLATLQGDAGKTGL